MYHVFDYDKASSDKILNVSDFVRAKIGESYEAEGTHVSGPFGSSVAIHSVESGHRLEHDDWDRHDGGLHRREIRH